MNKPTSPVAIAQEGSWPEKCPQRAFVEGAKWWQFHANGATAFSSEREEMEAEAIKRFGEPDQIDGASAFTTPSVELNRLLNIVFDLGAGATGHDVGMELLEALEAVIPRMNKTTAHARIRVRRRIFRGTVGSAVGK